MSYLRAALERGIKTRLKCNASLRIQGQKVLPKPSLQVFSLRWVQSKASQSKVPPKGLSDVQRALKKAPPVKPKGQDASRRLIATLAFGAFVYKYGPHTFLLDYVQPHYQHYTKGLVTTRVPPKLKALVEEVMEEAFEMTPEQMEKGNVFVGTATEAYAWGAAKAKYLVMLPLNMTYESPDQINLSNMRFGNASSSDKEAFPDQLSPAQLSSQADSKDQFVESLVLTEKAKKFVLARELERASTAHFQVPAIAMPLNLICMYVGAKKVNSALRLFYMHPSIRVAAYTLQAMFWGALSVTLLDMHKRKVERKVDEGASSKGAEYAEGGVEFYSKIIQRNIALRNLIPGDKGKKEYNLKGEHFRGLFRNKHLPFSQRKAICQKALEKNN